MKLAPILLGRVFGGVGTLAGLTLLAARGDENASLIMFVAALPLAVVAINFGAPEQAYQHAVNGTLDAESSVRGALAWHMVTLPVAVLLMSVALPDLSLVGGTLILIGRTWQMFAAEEWRVRDRLVVATLLEMVVTPAGLVLVGLFWRLGIVASGVEVLLGITLVIPGAAGLVMLFGHDRLGVKSSSREPSLRSRAALGFATLTWAIALLVPIWFFSDTGDAGTSLTIAYLSRVAAIVGLPLLAFNRAVPSVFAEYEAPGPLAESVRDLSLLLVIVSAVGGVAAAAATPRVGAWMAIPDVVPVQIAVLILSLGLAVHAAAGPVGLFLLSYGRPAAWLAAGGVGLVTAFVTVLALPRWVPPPIGYAITLLAVYTSANLVGSTLVHRFLDVRLHASSRFGSLRDSLGLLAPSGSTSRTPTGKS